MSAHFRKPSLGALTTAALALPGLGAAPAAAQTGDDWQTDYLYSFYKEGDIGGGKTSSGSSVERYEIQTHSLRAVKPIGERSVGVDFLYETLSGASPISVQPNTDGQPVQVMSNPTINEERFDLQLSGSTPLNARLALNMSAGVSDEDDYQARYGTAELSYELAELPMTVTGSLSYSDDELDPTQGTYPTDPAADNKSTLRGTASASYVLNRNTLVQAAAGFLRHSGYLSDPYKQFFVTGSGLSPFDARPDGRRGFHLIGKLRHFVERFNGAAHVDYRYYQDDWEIHSHTLELTWHQSLSQTWRISPGLRWYSQSQAFFYAPFFDQVREDGFGSSDYRLSPYGAISARLDVTKSWNQLAAGFGVEYYEADGSYATGSVDVESPGLVDYTVFTARLAYSF